MYKMWRWSGGLANAKENGWPVLLLGGASEARQDSLGAFQEWPQMDSVRWVQIKTTEWEDVTEAVTHNRWIFEFIFIKAADLIRELTI